MMQRRDFLMGAAAVGAAMLVTPAASAATKFELPPLPYDPAALEPHIDRQTMEIHHGKHHAAYVANLNAALAKNPGEWSNWDLERLLREVDRLPAGLQTAVRNNGGGHCNHSLFWKWMSPQKDQQPDGALAADVKRTFGSLDAFRTQLEDAGMGRFGSGWAWLVKQDGNLKILSTANQDSPLMQGQKPLLGVDVWEHAYYLKYQNRRKDYLDAWWHLVNWPEVARLYA